MSKKYFNSGCALSLYKPTIGEKLFELLNNGLGQVELHNICCRYEPKLEEGSMIVNVCAGCDRRFRNLYDGISTVSIWEVLNETENFDFPDYNGLKISVHDPCPVRERKSVHLAVRSILKKMNIEVVETKFAGSDSKCCGDDFYEKIPIEKVHELMINRAESMPCEDVCVYCVSCIKSMFIGGKTPRYLPDLLLGESTDPQVYDTVKWHELLNVYIETHKG